MAKIKKAVKKSKEKSCTKEDIKKLIDESESFVVVFNDAGGRVGSIRWNICAGDEIAALESVKFKTLHERMEK